MSVEQPASAPDGAQPKRKYVDTATPRYEGVYARHRLSCALAIGKQRCTCKPSYWGKVWDRAAGRHRKTKFYPLVGEAKNARADLLANVRAGTVADAPACVETFAEVCEEFIRECRAGVARNKKGKEYKPKAIKDLESSLGTLPDEIRKKRADRVTSADLQRAVDVAVKEGKSSSRISSRINAARSMYRWAEKRGKVKGNAAEDVQLPADDSEECTRVATPGEFAFLLTRLEDRDALPWALAAYASARHQEIQTLEWPEVDFDHDLLLLAESEEARKSEAARRPVPMVRPLRRLLYREWIRQGCPESGKVCPPRRKSKSGLLSLNNLLKVVARRWKKAGLTPITLQHSRHTCATWLDPAGVSPKVASVFMGHKAPSRKLYPDAAPISLRRYTHLLPRELIRAGELLDAFLVEREEAEQHHDFTLVA
jgi:integrase